LWVPFLFGNIQSLKQIVPNCDPHARAIYAVAVRDWDCAVSLGKDAVDLLILALKDVDWKVREGAALALGKIRDARAVEPLILGLKDPMVAVRWRAASSLGEIGDARAVEPLISALKYQDSSMRLEAAIALESIGSVTDPMTQLWIAMGKREWEKVVALGSVAVEPLLERVENQFAENRRDVAYALVKLYTDGNLDEEARQKILAERKTIHQDHKDVGGTCPFPDHDDTPTISLP
jgi:HEAT repeat protein